MLITDLERNTGKYKDELGLKTAILSFINAALKCGAGKVNYVVCVCVCVCHCVYCAWRYKMSLVMCMWLYLGLCSKYVVFGFCMGLCSRCVHGSVWWCVKVCIMIYGRILISCDVNVENRSKSEYPVK